MSPQQAAASRSPATSAAGLLDQSALTDLAQRLVEAAKVDTEISDVQRLGFLLDSVGASQSTNALAAWLAEQHGYRRTVLAVCPKRNLRASSSTVGCVLICLPFS